MYIWYIRYVYMNTRNWITYMCVMLIIEMELCAGNIIHFRLMYWRSCESVEVFLDRKCLDPRGIRTRNVNCALKCTWSTIWYGVMYAMLCYVMTWYNMIWYSFCKVNILTHWGLDKMAAFSQTALSNAFSLMKILEFRLKFHWSLFPRVLLTISQHWFW